METAHVTKATVEVKDENHSSNGNPEDEISAYGSLRALAEVMGFEEAAETLQETLDEEAETDTLLSGLAETINQEAFTEVAKEEN